MYNFVRVSFLVAALCVGLIAQTSPAKAGQLNYIIVTGSSGSETDYEFLFAPNHDDGDGHDYVAVVCVNADGTVSDVDIFDYTVTTLSVQENSDCDQEFGPAYNEPITLEFHDPSTVFTGDENSPEGLAYARGGGNNTTDCVNPDGRLNPCEGGATAVVYCENNGVTVYAIYQGVGYLAFKMTKAEIDAFPKNPTRNLLIKQAKGARLYRLRSGELQVNRAGERGQDYVFRWPGCDNS